MLAGCQSSVVTMGKLSSTWYSVNNHYGASGKPLLLSGPHLHLKPVSWVTTWQFSKCKEFFQLSAMAEGNGEEAGLGEVMRIWVRCVSFPLWAST